MRFGRKVQDPDNPQKGKAWAAGAGVALTIISLGLLTWMAMDVDNDGRSSYSEFQSGTSPMHGDTDGDGIADGWELDHGFDALSAESVPDVFTGDVLDAVEGVADCSLNDILLAGCDDDAGGSQTPAQPPSSDAEAVPPPGGSGSVGTLAIGGTTTLVAGVAARLISSAILHK